MASRLLTDELWKEIEGFFPERPVSPLGGRPAADNRAVLTSIVFVLNAGIAWEDLPLELGCSYKTCGRRLREWTSAGVWQQVFVHLLTELRIAGRLELADVLIDAGLVKAPLGGQKPARTRRIGAACLFSVLMGEVRSSLIPSARTSHRGETAAALDFVRSSFIKVSNA